MFPFNKLAGGNILAQGLEESLAGAGAKHVLVISVQKGVGEAGIGGSGDIQRAKDQPSWVVWPNKWYIHFRIGVISSFSYIVTIFVMSIFYFWIRI